MRGGALGLGGAGFVVVVVRLLGAVIQHEGLGLMGDGDGAGTLGPRLPVHLHGHLGALEHQLQRRQHTDKELLVGGLALSFACQAKKWPHMSRLQIARKKGRHQSKARTGAIDRCFGLFGAMKSPVLFVNGSLINANKCIK